MSLSVQQFLADETSVVLAWEVALLPYGKMQAATYLVVDENLEMKRSVVERSPSQVAVSPSVLPQGKR